MRTEFSSIDRYFKINQDRFFSMVSHTGLINHDISNASETENAAQLIKLNSDRIKRYPKKFEDLRQELWPRNFSLGKKRVFTLYPSLPLSVFLLVINQSCCAYTRQQVQPQGQTGKRLPQNDFSVEIFRVTQLFFYQSLFRLSFEFEESTNCRFLII